MIVAKLDKSVGILGTPYLQLASKGKQSCGTEIVSEAGINSSQ